MKLFAFIILAVNSNGNAFDSAMVIHRPIDKRRQTIGKRNQSFRKSSSDRLSAGGGVVVSQYSEMEM